MTHSPTCPKCLRPLNEGNSPNAAECNETDDDEGLCEVYAKVAHLRAALEDIATTAHCLAKAGPLHTPTLADAWSQFMRLDRMATAALHPNP